MWHILNDLNADLFSKIGRYFTWCTFSHEKRSVLNQK